MLLEAHKGQTHFKETTEKKNSIAKGIDNTLLLFM